ncbi:hypothetical protein O3Q52_42955, partial [Streptomyces sp. ActVer]|nr:hypothetical protein [Streptomyces sp. ActVer]
LVGDVRGKGMGAVGVVAVLIGAFREADEASWASGLDAGVLEDWRTVLELVAARHARPRTVG